MTVDEVLKASLARTMEYGVNFPSSRASLIRRVSQRQMEIFALANQTNPDYFGTCATAPLTDGMADLRTMAPPVYSSDTVSRVEVAAPGASSYADGDEVSVVSFDDKGSAFPPRVTLRDMLMKGVGADLDGVTSVRVYYARMPAELPLDDLAVFVELPLQFQELLVIDLARTVLKRAPGIGPEERAAIVAPLDAEESALLTSFAHHVSRHNGSQVQRFASRTTVAAP
jgi:hypothetical protein